MKRFAFHEKVQFNKRFIETPRVWLCNIYPVTLLAKVSSNFLSMITLCVASLQIFPLWRGIVIQLRIAVAYLHSSKQTQNVGLLGRKIVKRIKVIFSRFVHDSHLIVYLLLCSGSIVDCLFHDGFNRADGKAISALYAF